MIYKYPTLCSDHIDLGSSAIEPTPPYWKLFSNFMHCLGGILKIHDIVWLPFLVITCILYDTDVYWFFVMYK